jgi:hypothetical protein
MKYAVAAFKPLWKALKRENDHVQSMERVVADQGRIGLVTKGRVK